MRRVTFGGAVSLDAFLAGPADAMDWLRWSPDVAAITQAFWPTIDAVVMGRRTWEVAVAGRTRAYPGVANYVCSRTRPSGTVDGVEFTADGVTLVRRLRQAPGRGICVMGGGMLGASLLDAGLVDEIGLNVHPLVLGSGVPLLPGLTHSIDLRLVECRVLQEGCVLLRYAVSVGREA
jgi:dihydrofolate reductase